MLLKTPAQGNLITLSTPQSIADSVKRHSRRLKAPDCELIVELPAPSLPSSPATPTRTREHEVVGGLGVGGRKRKRGNVKLEESSKPRKRRKRAKSEVPIEESSTAASSIPARTKRASNVAVHAPAQEAATVVPSTPSSSPPSPSKPKRPIPPSIPALLSDGRSLASITKTSQLDIVMAAEQLPYSKCMPPIPLPAHIPPFLSLDTISPHFEGRTSPYFRSESPRGLHVRYSPQHFGLIQELTRSSPFHFLVAVILLNVTRGAAAIPVLWEIIRRWRTEVELAEAPYSELFELLEPLGLGKVRTERLLKLARQFLDDPYDAERTTVNKNAKELGASAIGQYVGVGRYAIDSYNIFIAGGGSELTPTEAASRTPIAPKNADAPWREVMPSDKELQRYLKWRWGKEGRIWDSRRGLLD